MGYVAGIDAPASETVVRDESESVEVGPRDLYSRVERFDPVIGGLSRILGLRRVRQRPLHDRTTERWTGEAQHARHDHGNRDETTKEARGLRPAPSLYRHEKHKSHDRGPQPKDFPA